MTSPPHTHTFFRETTDPKRTHRIVFTKRTRCLVRSRPIPPKLLRHAVGLVIRLRLHHLALSCAFPLLLFESWSELCKTYERERKRRLRRLLLGLLYLRDDTTVTIDGNGCIRPSWNRWDKTSRCCRCPKTRRSKSFVLRTVPCDVDVRRP
jgi:hypothetical protein